MRVSIQLLLSVASGVVEVLMTSCGDHERDSWELRDEPMERGWATAATVSCAVQQNAAVVRVHDVLEMGDVVRIASALWG